MLTLIMPAAPKPSTMRAMVSVESEVEKAQANDESVKTASPDQ